MRGVHILSQAVSPSATRKRTRLLKIDNLSQFELT